MHIRRYIKWGTSVVTLAAIAVITTALMPVCASAFADSIDETLDAAKKKYEAARTEAKYAVVARYREVVTALTEMKSIEAAVRSQDEMVLFEKSGILIPRTEMSRAFQKYGESQRKMSGDLAAAYTDALAAHAKAGNLAKADELRIELAALSLPTKCVSLQILRTKTYIQHAEYKGVAKPAISLAESMNSTFEIVNGLATSGYVSIRSTNVPNHFLAHGNLRVFLSRFEDNDGFRKNATFKRVNGLATPSAVSFESINFPGHFIRARETGELWVDKKDSLDAFRQEATFVIVEPRFKLW